MNKHTENYNRNYDTGQTTDQVRLSKRQNKIVPVGVIGLGSLFPGSSNIQGYWRDIMSGRNMVSEVPPSHLHIEHFYDPDPHAVDKTYCKQGAFLSPVEFDPIAFGIPPKNISSIDSSQLLSLLVAKQVLEDAFHGKFKNMDRSRIGIIMGVAAGLDLLGEMAGRLTKFQWVKGMREAGLQEDKIEEICDRILNSFVPWTENTFPGLLANVVSGRIANHFDLGGINCTSDAACASSFSALSHALNELYVGTSDVVIIGGADTNNDSFLFVSFSKTPALSPTHDCRPFSDKADGMVLGEGIAMLALKRLDDAIRDGDRIYAVIRGIGASSDGAGSSIYAPVAEGQANALKRCYEAAAYGPETVELVEAHGTATLAGDVIEVKALKSVFQNTQRKDSNWCALGSVKSQIGHTKSTAATAGIIKAILGLHHKVLPPTIKVERVNPNLGIENSPFYVNTQTRPWVKDDSYPRRASVSAFGFGGTNFHVTLEEYRGPGKSAYRLRNAPSELVMLSSSDPKALKERCIETAASLDEEGMLPYIAKTSQESFDASSPARLAIVATNEKDLKGKLSYAQKVLQDEPDSGFATPNGIYCSLVKAEPGAIAFLFPGQGSSGYVGMGSDLSMFFSDAMDIWDRVATFDKNRKAVVPLHRVVYPIPVFTEAERNAQAEKLKQTKWAQPAVLTTSIAMSQILKGLGIKPSYVGGHSLGEISALYDADVVDFDGLLNMCFKRSELMAEASSKQGTMTAVFGDASKMQGILDKLTTKIVISNYNDPTQVVLSGPVPDMEKVELALKEEKLKFNRLPVDAAFHSFLMDEACKSYRKYLKTVKFKPPKIPIYSNINGERHESDTDKIREALAKQINSPVQFVDEVEAMYSDGARIFLEVGPSNVLSYFVDNILKDRPHTTINIDSKNENGVTSLWKSLGKISLAGIPLDFSYLWKGFAPVSNPMKMEKPKFSVTLSGANYGKKYPSPEGIDSFPKPNPSSPEVISNESAQLNAGSCQVNHNTINTAAMRSRKQQSKETGMSRLNNSPAPNNFRSATLATQSETAPIRSNFGQQASLTFRNEPHPNQRNIRGNGSSYLAEYFKIQKQTAEAHSVYQKTMAKSHISFLNAAESSNMALCALLTGQPLQRPTNAAQDDTTIFSQVVNTESYSSAPPSKEPPAFPSEAFVTTCEATQQTAAVCQNNDLKDLFLAIVSDKTGYPIEILTIDMNLEADLGIDSIKRVEIFSAVKDEHPWLPEIEAEAMSEIQTLGDIITFIEKHAPQAGLETIEKGPVEKAASVQTKDINFEDMFLTIVADKTGYPKEILNLEMNLESDLGIDSIKRVEIFSAIKDEHPWLPEIEAEAMSEIHTLGDIIKLIEKHTPQAGLEAIEKGPAEKAVSVQTKDINFEDMFLTIVADKTGYPKEILNLEMNLESDLGIDSIKRVEIFSAIKDKNPDLPEADPKMMSTINTLKDVIDYLKRSSIELNRNRPTYTDSITSDEKTALKGSQIGRYVLKAVSAPHSGFAMPGLIEAKRICVFDDETGVANALIQKLKDSAINAAVVKEVPDDCDALIYLGGLRNISRRQDAIDINREAFAAAKKIASRLSQSNGLFVTVQNTGGDFGLSGKSDDRAWLGGLSGLVKSASIEWPKASLKAIDIDCGRNSAGEIAEAVSHELLNGGPETEIMLKLDGSRYRLMSYEKSNSSSISNTIDKDSIIVVSGGAKGVTAKALIQLAQKAKPRLVLLGRTDLEDEPDFCQSAKSDAEIKSALLAEANAKGRKVSPKELGNKSKKILAMREIMANLEAIKRAGSQVRYVAVDVLDESRLKSELQRIRMEWGPITGLVHAAGVLADKLIAEKTMDQFELVFNTKVKGLESLLTATAQDPLKTICLFSSIAGRTGNMGQSDYAMANEVLNKVAGAESFRRKGDCLVKSLNWGPWDGGMVSILLKDYFKEKGIPLIPVDIGSQYFVDEIMGGTSEDVEIVVGPKPSDGVLSISPIEKVINLSLHVNKEKYPFIDSHRIKDVPVVPLALVLEWFIKAAELYSPDLDYVVCKNLKVLRGITLNNFTTGSEHLKISCQQVSNGGMPLRLALTLPAPNGGAFYSAEVEMSLNDQARDKVMRSKKNGLPSWKWNVTDIYKEKLFHGPKFQVIRSLEGVSEEKATCILNGTNEMSWPDAPWVNDVAAIDGGLQLAILWGEYNKNATSLPTSIGTYHRYQNGPITGPIYCELNGKLLRNDRTLSDILFFDNKGMLAANLCDVELHMLSE